MKTYRVRSLLAPGVIIERPSSPPRIPAEDLAGIAGSLQEALGNVIRAEVQQAVRQQPERIIVREVVQQSTPHAPLASSGRIAVRWDFAFEYDQLGDDLTGIDAKPQYETRPDDPVAWRFDIRKGLTDRLLGMTATAVFAEAR